MPRRNFQNLSTPQAACKYQLRRRRQRKTSSRQIPHEDQKEVPDVQHQPLVQQPAQALRSAVEDNIQHRRLEDPLKIAEDLLKLNQAFQESESIFLDLPHRKVFRYGDVVFKFGLDVSPFEAETLQFIKSITIPAPRLYYNGVHSDGTVVILMEHIEGELLSELWPALHHNEKISIIQQLREILEKMRQHQGDYIGGINDAPAVDIRMHTRKGGPFKNEEQFNEFLRSTIHPRVPELYCHMLQDTMRTDHNIVLTHGDINPRNIIIAERQTVRALLDWESAGWYPEYWEFVKFLNAIDFSTDWCDHAKAIFPQTYPHQYLTDSYLNRLLSY